MPCKQAFKIETRKSLDQKISFTETDRSTFNDILKKVNSLKEEINDLKAELKYNKEEIKRLKLENGDLKQALILNTAQIHDMHQYLRRENF